MHVLYLVFLCSPYAAPVFLLFSIAQGAKVLDKWGVKARCRKGGSAVSEAPCRHPDWAGRITKPWLEVGINRFGCC